MHPDSDTTYIFKERTDLTDPEFGVLRHIDCLIVKLSSKSMVDGHLEGHILLSFKLSPDI